MRRRTFLRSGMTTLAAGVAVAGGSVAAVDGAAGYAPLGRLDLPGAKELVTDADGATAYVAVTDGFATVDLADPASPELLAERRGLMADSEAGPMRQVYDVKVEGDRLVVAAPANRSSGFVGFLVYDVSDPSNPVREMAYEAGTSIHNCDIHAGHVYLTGNAYVDKPLVVVDVTGDEPTEVARWSLLDHDDSWNTLPQWSYTLHDVYVEGGMAYLAYWEAGTWIVDVSDPAAPAYVADFGDYRPEDLEDLSRDESQVEYVEPDGNAHYVTVDDDASLLATGGESWDTRLGDGHGGPTGVDLWDLADPSSPSMLASIEPAAVDNGTHSNGTWTTSHNFELRGDRLYSGWYDDGVRLFDVADQSAPEEIAHWRRPGEYRFWTAQAAKPGEFFVASDMGASSPSSAGVVTFPDEPGSQADMPPLEPSPTPSPSSTASPTGTATPTPSGHTPTSTPTASATPTATTMPGFGVLAALGGLALGGARYLARDDRE